jgi:hypothetical protein
VGKKSVGIREKRASRYIESMIFPSRPIDSFTPQKACSASALGDGVYFARVSAGVIANSDSALVSSHRMRLDVRRPLTIVIGIVLCATTSIELLWSTADTERAQDRNRDRPDLWRSSDSRDQVASVAVDTNFDGRTDVREFYEEGALVRRELDRDFNNQIDLVQEFDPSTRQIMRSISDLDSDGVADLLLLFRDGQPVYSKWASAGTRADTSHFPASSTLVRSTARRTLAGLADPFAGDLTLRKTRSATAFGNTPGLSVSFGLPRPSHESKPLSTFSSAVTVSRQPAAATSISPVSPRGPPTPQL